VKPKIKICCISSIDEANLALSYGADALGLVGNMPSGPGVISDELIADIAKTIPQSKHSFLLTSETSGEAIVQHHQRTKTNTIQLVDEVLPDSFTILRNSIPAVKLVQVVHIIDEKSID
jgi:phosphoribosylanthranilate isomerase